jgi:hypothetical protein
VAGAVTLGGIATFSAQPIFSSLTASSAVATDASKGLVSVTNTGTGNNVLATSPTITTPTISSLSSASATALTLQSAGTTAVTIDTSQNVGIGVTPASWASTYRALQIRNLGIMTINDSNWLYSNTYYNGTNNVYTSTGYAGAFDFNGVVTGGYSWRVAASGTAGNTISYTQAMVIDNSGNVGIGTTSPSTYGLLTVNGNLSILGSNQVKIYNSSNNDQYGIYNNGSTGQATLSFRHASVDAMTLDNSGNLLVGTTSSLNGALLTVQNSGGSGIATGYGTTAGQWRRMYINTSNQGLYFYNGNNEGYLSSAGAWTNASDARLKTNIRTIEYGLNTVLQIQPRHFERVDVDGTYIGFVAQELQQIIPEVVSGDAERQLGVDYGSLVAVAFKAIQELKAINDTQAETINALTARIVALETK